MGLKQEVCLKCKLFQIRKFWEHNNDEVLAKEDYWKMVEDDFDAEWRNGKLFCNVTDKIIIHPEEIEKPPNGCDYFLEQLV